MGFNVSSHISGNDNISSKFDFQGPGLKVKVDMTEVFAVVWDLIPPNLKSRMFTIPHLNANVIYDLYSKITGFLFLHSHNYYMYMSRNSPFQCLPTQSSHLYRLWCHSLFFIAKTRLCKYIEKFNTKKWKCSDKKFWYFSYFCSKHRLLVLVRTASMRRF